MTPADLLTLLGLLSVVTFVGSLVAVPWLIGRMRADYFLTHWQVVQARHRRHPALALTVFLARNALGLLLVAAGIVLLGNAVWATAFQVLVIGWTNLISGVVLLIGSLFRIRSGGFFSAVLGGAFLTVMGLFILRNPVVGALALTLAAGMAFFAAGLTRMVWAFRESEGKVVLFISGLVSLGLGFYVLFNLGTATLMLLGTLLAVQTLLEGLTLIAVGRVRPGKPGADPTA